MEPSVIERFKEFKKRKKITQDELAHALGLSQSAISQQESKGKLSIELIEYISTTYKISLNWLFYNRGEMELGAIVKPTEGIDALKKEIATLKARIAKMEEEATLRKSLITSYEYQIKRLTDDLEKLKKAS
jgi:transcriptional regulator with XRE-family HTH domain